MVAMTTVIYILLTLKDNLHHRHTYKTQFSFVQETKRKYLSHTVLTMSDRSICESLFTNVWIRNSIGIT